MNRRFALSNKSNVRIVLTGERKGLSNYLNAAITSGVCYANSTLGSRCGRLAATVTAQGIANPADLLLEGRGHRRWPLAAQAAEPSSRNLLLRLEGRGALANPRSGFASVMRPSIRLDALGAPTKPCTAWFCPESPVFCGAKNAPKFSVYSASTQKISIQNLRLSCRSWKLCPPLGVRRSAQGIGGARSGRGAGP
jgi:hypothetical protein